MAKDLAVELEDRPGTLADLGEALGNAGINIDGGCGFPVGGRATLHILVEDATATRKAIEGAGLSVTGERDVVILDVTDKPGELGAIARRMADAGVNIDLVYLTARGQLVLGVDNLEKARSA
ncbi:MAG TPA: ACT domain-containing protein [Actinomycetota bacterium]|jgi:hypothetical protein|nr:ACT domain-containing protein [Actinomycetota bacterium]